MMILKMLFETFIMTNSQSYRNQNIKDKYMKR